MLGVRNIAWHSRVERIQSVTHVASVPPSDLIDRLPASDIWPEIHCSIGPALEMNCLRNLPSLATSRDRCLLPACCFQLNTNNSPIAMHPQALISTSCVLDTITTITIYLGYSFSTLRHCDHTSDIGFTQLVLLCSADMIHHQLHTRVV